MKKNGQNLIIVALVFLNFLNYFKINNLENSIERCIQLRFVPERSERNVRLYEEDNL